MPSFKATARERISTPDSVRRLALLIAREVTEAPENVQQVRDQTIDSHILQSAEYVAAVTYNRYGGNSALKTTPWWNPPLSVLKNNEASNILTGVTLGPAAITEQWIIRATTPDAYTVTGSISGLQTATGTFAADYTSDAGDVIITSAMWSLDGTNDISEGDQWVFSIFLYHPLIVMITDYMAVSTVLNYFLSGQTVNASDLGQVYWDRAMQMLEELSKGTININSVPDVELDPAAILYRVDDYGIDSTEYAPDPDTSFKYRTDNVYPPFRGDIRVWYWGSVD